MALQTHTTTSSEVELEVKTREKRQVSPADKHDIYRHAARTADRNNISVRVPINEYRELKTPHNHRHLPTDPLLFA